MSDVKVNNIQKRILIPRIESYFNNDLKGKTIGVWGLSFKPETDDIREAPSLLIIEDLLSKGAKIKVFDPEAMDNVRAIYGDRIEFAKDEYEALQGADALFISTEWPIFRTPEFDRMESALKNKIIFDGRNLYDLDKMRKHGFKYFSIGRAGVE